MKRILALMLIIVLALAGCSTGSKTEVTTKDDDPSASGTSSVTETTDAVTGDPAQGIYDDKIVVGTTGAQQGPLAFIGKPYFDGMKAYFEMVNEAGGVGGKTIETIILEDEFKPENSIANVQKLIDDEQVFALVGLFGTPGVKASIPLVQEAEIPAVYFATGATAPTLAGENFFPVQPNYHYEGKLMSKYALDYFKAQKIAVIYRSDDVGLDGLAGIKEGLKIQSNEDALVAELSFDAGTTDFTAQIAKVKDSGADVVICYALSGGLSGVLKEMEKMGMTELPIIAPYPNVSDSFITANLEASPNVIENLYGMGWVDMTRPAVQDMVDAMTKYFPESAVNAYTVSGWIAAETFVKGLEIAVDTYSYDHLSWENYVSAMGTLEYTEGIIPRITYKNGLREGVVNMTLTEVEGATWVNRTDYLSFD